MLFLGLLGFQTSHPKVCLITQEPSIWNLSILEIQGNDVIFFVITLRRLSAYGVDLEDLCQILKHNIWCSFRQIYFRNLNKIEAKCLVIPKSTLRWTFMFCTVLQIFYAKYLHLICELYGQSDNFYTKHETNR